MDASAWLLLVVVAVIVPSAALSLSMLNRIDNRLKRLEARSEHDALSPVFSTSQVRQARDRFAGAYWGQLRLEKALYESPQWRARVSETAPSAELVEQMRRVCESVVEAECAWKEYVFMVDGNVRVAHRGESGRKIITEWEDLLESTRGAAAGNFLSSNAAKLERVDKWLNSWVARLSGSTAGGKGEELDTELFRDVWEDQEQWRRSVQ